MGLWTPFLGNRLGATSPGPLLYRYGATGTNLIVFPHPLAMLEPFSIVTTVLALVGGTAKLLEHIDSLRKKMRKVQLEDSAIDTLWVEIDILKKNLQQLHGMCTDFDIGATDTDSTVQKSETKYWSNIKETMIDCKASLDSLEVIIVAVKQKDKVLHRITRVATIQTRLEGYKEAIDLHKQQITGYRRAISMSLQVIVVYRPAK
jgi:hypothetical protein